MLLHDISDAAVLAFDGNVGMPPIQLYVLEGMAQASAAAIAKRYRTIHFDDIYFCDELLRVASVLISGISRLLGKLRRGRRVSARCCY